MEAALKRGDLTFYPVRKEDEIVVSIHPAMILTIQLGTLVDALTALC